jgi:hypothetical protein
MYFPYFRGRQYELLALRELAESHSLTENIVPVIEPIKLSPTFHSTIEAYIASEQRIGIIFNPAVGDLSKDKKAINEMYSFLDEDKVIPSVIINPSMPNCLRDLEAREVSREDILTVLDNRDSLRVYETEFESVSPKFTLFPDDRKIRRTVKQNKILFENKFGKQARNADYPADEFFSEDHLYYAEEGFDGFGDYSIVGDEYAESAFAPYAVAIHIVYFAEDKTLRIQHFISDSNLDISDVAGKFYEAVSKLAAWYQKISPRPSTKGLETLLRHYSNGTYPGLPTLKKLSIMHHLELLGKFLAGEGQA